MNSFTKTFAKTFTRRAAFLPILVGLVAGTGCTIEFTDTDGDGVEDIIDLCANSGAEFVNTQGCLDADRDGVSDIAFDGRTEIPDMCLGSAAGASVDRDGCAIVDADGDGVSDAIDQCPGTPAGVVVDPATGCEPIVGMDADNDGVPDASDVCQNTPAGEAVDTIGCAASQVATLAGSWQINGAAATEASCAEAGIVNVRLTANIGSGDGALHMAWDIACGTGSFDSSTDATGITLPLGMMFFTNWRAIDAAGAMVSNATDFLEADTAAVTHINLAIPDFIVVAPNELTVNLFWATTDVMGGILDTCAIAGVETMNYTLIAPDGTTELASEMGVACADSLVFRQVGADAIPALMAGTFILDVAATGAGGAPKWGAGAGCNLTYAGGQQALNCDVEQRP